MGLHPGRGHRLSIRRRAYEYDHHYRLTLECRGGILDLIRDRVRHVGAAVLFISHDLNLVRQVADRVLVMYLGRIVEERAIVSRAVNPPLHPYSEALLAAVPVPDPSIAARPIRLTGPLPSPKNPPPGCGFATRCPRRLGALCDSVPPDRRPSTTHRIACHIDVEALARVAPIWRRLDDDAASRENH
jgi:peptide/nickel transport system ATP-binding protein